MALLPRSFLTSTHSSPFQGDFRSNQGPFILAFPSVSSLPGRTVIVCGCPHPLGHDVVGLRSDIRSDFCCARSVIPLLTFRPFSCVHLSTAPFLLCPADFTLAVFPRIMATTTAAAAAATNALELRRQLLNVRTAKYFAVAMAALMGLFIIYHWTRFFYHRYAPKEKGRVARTVVGWQRLIIFLFPHGVLLTQQSRNTRRFFFRRVAGYQLDRSIVVFVYLAINLVLAFSPSLLQYHYDPLVNTFAKHWGCMSILLMHLEPPTLAPH